MYILFLISNLFANDPLSTEADAITNLYLEISLYNFRIYEVSDFYSKNTNVAIPYITHNNNLKTFINLDSPNHLRNTVFIKSFIIAMIDKGLVEDCQKTNSRVIFYDNSSSFDFLNFDIDFFKKNYHKSRDNILYYRTSDGINLFFIDDSKIISEDSFISFYTENCKFTKK